MRRSLAEEASRLLCILEKRTLLTSLVCYLRLKSLVLTFLMSQTATEVSEDPVTIRFLSKGEQSTLIISCTWPSIQLVAFLVSLESQILSFLSSPTVQKMN